MPANQTVLPSGAGTPVVGIPTKSNLVRSKSLRLAPTKPKPESSTSTLSRHGSIRLPKSQSTLTANFKPPFTFSKKPPLKPKPAFLTSRSEHAEKSRPGAEGEGKKMNFVTQRAHAADLHRTPNSESPTSLHSDKSQSQEASLWCSTDLVAHLKRLTEEHEKLQMEHARLRLQLAESVPRAVSLQHAKQSSLPDCDSQPASMSENVPDGANCLAGDDPFSNDATGVLIHSYKNEILRLQEDNRKLQRKYWDQVLNSDLVEDETCNGASQQIVDLIDKLNDKEKELLEASGRVQELENHLAAATLELHQCQGALREASHQRDDARKLLSEWRHQVGEARENLEFMQLERAALSESLQESEQSLMATKAEMMKCESKNNDLMECARKLYAKVKDKNLQIQQLRAELDRTAGSCQDMLLSQGAELTMISLHLPQMSRRAHTILTSAADFAASQLSLQKEMLEDIMADLDSEGDSSSNELPKSNSNIPESASSNSLNDKPPDSYRSLPDPSSYESAASSLQSSSSSELDKPLSLVQSIVRAYEQTSKPDPTSSKTPPDDLPNGNLSPTKDDAPAGGAFKPIGLATPFRPIRQQGPEEGEGREEAPRKSSLEAQLTQVDCLVKKVGKVIQLMQQRFLERAKEMANERDAVQEELKTLKSKQSQLQTNLNNSNYLVEQSNLRMTELSSKLAKAEQDRKDEKEELLLKIGKLKEEISCLKAVSEEQSQQIEKELKTMMNGITNTNSEYLSNALAICDKLHSKQEIARLNALVSQKEAVLEKLAQKFNRTTAHMEENLKKAEKEISILDDVIGEISSALNSNPDLVEQNEVLKSIFLLVNLSTKSGDTSRT